MIDLLGEYGIHAGWREGAPGVYLDTENGLEKIASFGLCIRHGCSYHGLSLNVDMDLTPFTAINPCGYEGLKMTRMADYADPCPTWSEVLNLVYFLLYILFLKLMLLILLEELHF